MANAPDLIITGNLTADPELRFTSGGVAVAKFSVAHNTRVKNTSGEWEDGDPTFLWCTAWRDLAEHIAESLHKGDRVVVTGRLEQQHWEKDGEKRSGYQLQVDDIGPSLRWATVGAITRTKSSGGGRRQDTAPNDPWASASKTRPANADQTRAASAYDDEPPF